MVFSISQIQQSKTIAKYLQHKFTNEELYQWLSGRISALYHQSNDLSVKTKVQSPLVLK
jgi:hypothetical protein